MNYIRIPQENIDTEHICCAMSGKQRLTGKAAAHALLLAKTLPKGQWAHRTNGENL